MKNLQSSLLIFESELDNAIEDAWKTDDLQLHLEGLVHGANVLFSAISAIGDEAAGQLSADGSAETEDLLPWLINYRWAGYAKSFLILWRDVLFQQHKSQIQAAENTTGIANLIKLKVRSKEAVTSAASELIAFINDEISAIQQSKSGSRAAIAKWQLKKNPWPVYKEQMTEIPGQCQNLLNGHEELLSVAKAFKEADRLVASTVEDCQKEIQAIKQFIGEALAMIEEETSESGERNPGRIASGIEGIAAQIKISNHQLGFTENLDSVLGSLPAKSDVVIGTEEGMLLVQEASFGKNAQKWLESEILPLLYEVWELTGNASHGIKMSFVNIKNRALMLSADAKNGKTPDFAQEDFPKPLNDFHARLSNAESDIAVLYALAKQRMENEFRLSIIFDTSRSFLPATLPYSINQIAFSKNKYWAQSQAWLEKQMNAIRQFKAVVKQEESLSTAEKIIRSIKSREGDAENSYYSSIFLTRGYVGESFVTGRQEELKQVSTTVAHWNDGYRGAVLLTGQRFSGKTLFGEVIAARFFPENTIRLSPGNTITVQGRKMETGYDLESALDFIKKHTLDVRPLILIDNFEYWWEPATPLMVNVRSLTRFIDNYSNRFFIVVSMSNLLKAHIDQFVPLAGVFQSVINLDRMAQEDIQSAILIHHGATHKTLVNAEGNKTSPRQFKKLTGSVCKAAKGNIGEAMKIWAYSTRKVDEQKVITIVEDKPPLPEQLSPDKALLLVSIFLQKRTNEYRLRKLFGPAFSEKYTYIIRRLIHIGLLNRQLDGWLEINEVLVNDLGRLLERKQYIKYRR